MDILLVGGWGGNVVTELLVKIGNFCDGFILMEDFLIFAKALI